MKVRPPYGQEELGVLGVGGGEGGVEGGGEW